MSKATREAFGETLVELADEGVDVVVVEADLSKSTTTAKLADAYPERFFNVGIAEQNMIGVAAGLAVSGKVAFTGSCAVFATGRAYDQVRNTVCYSELDVKLAPTHSGITVGPDGGSHQMIEDLALMRVLPGMRVLVPADYRAAKSALRAAALEPGPFYIRLGRASLPEVYPEDFEFEVGRAYVLREGTDVTIAACGVEVAEALKAAELLDAEGVSAEVIELLRPQSVIMRGGPRVVPLPNGNLTMNRVATGGTFSYTGEQQDIGASRSGSARARVHLRRATTRCHQHLIGQWRRLSRRVIRAAPINHHDPHAPGAQ